MKGHLAVEIDVLPISMPVWTSSASRSGSGIHRRRSRSIPMRTYSLAGRTRARRQSMTRWRRCLPRGDGGKCAARNDLVAIGWQLSRFVLRPPRLSL